VGHTTHGVDAVPLFALNVCAGHGPHNPALKPKQLKLNCPAGHDGHAWHTPPTLYWKSAHSLHVPSEPCPQPLRT
jgi:hypothetical protein